LRRPLGALTIEGLILRLGYMRRGQPESSCPRVSFENPGLPFYGIFNVASGQIVVEIVPESSTLRYMGVLTILNGK
jgi:hypothetical protein